MPFKFNILFFILIIPLEFLFSACSDNVSYDVVPSIEFKEYKILNYANTNRDSAIQLTISFVDGDGDLGLTQEDTLDAFNVKSQYYYNFYAYYYEYVNGKFIQLRPEIDSIIIPNSDTIRYKYRFPDIRSQSNNKALKGDITVTITDIQPVKSNIIKLSVFIYDRALHKSNTVETPSITYKP